MQLASLKQTHFNLVIYRRFRRRHHHRHHRCHHHHRRRCHPVLQCNAVNYWYFSFILLVTGTKRLYLKVSV